MIELDVDVSNRLGLHARAAAKFVHLANTFSARISVSKGTAQVDGKSILGLLTLAAARGSKLKLAAEGQDAAEALDALRGLVEHRFGEDE